MSHKRDLAGQKFGKLTVINAEPRGNHHSMWKCLCDCGKETIVSMPALAYGSTKTCGCSKHDKTIDPKEKKRRKAVKDKERDGRIERKEQKAKNQMKYQVSDKAIVAAFHRWAKKRKNKISITDEEILGLRKEPCHGCGKTIEGTGTGFTLINPRQPVSLANMRSTCGICKLIKPKDSFSIKIFCIQILRRRWKQSPMASIAKQKARRGRGKYECAGCKELFSERDMQLDHIDPVVDPSTGYIDLDTYANRLFCDDNKLQMLCKPCHSIKTKAENIERVTLARGKK